MESKHLQTGDRIELVSGADAGPVIERFMNRPTPEPLSQAAIEVPTIVAYEQPITCAEISWVVETLLARKLLEGDRRFGSRGQPRFLTPTADLLRALGLDSARRTTPATCVARYGF